MVQGMESVHHISVVYWPGDDPVRTFCASPSMMTFAEPLLSWPVTMRRMGLALSAIECFLACVLLCDRKLAARGAPGQGRGALGASGQSGRSSIVRGTRERADTHAPVGPQDQTIRFRAS